MGQNSKAQALRDEVMVLIKQHRKAGTMPTNTRFLFYELVTLGKLTKADKFHEDGSKIVRKDSQNLSDALTYLREKSTVLWSEIEDETRTVTDYSSTGTVKTNLYKMLDTCDDDFWGGKPAPIVICESRSLMGVLRSTAYKYHVTITSTNGECVGHLHTKVADAMTSDGSTRPVLFLGDWDFSGGHIVANTRKVSTEIFGELNWTNVALTEEQIKKFKLTPVKKWDDRDHTWHLAVETEALKQELIVKILDKTLRKLLPMPLDELRAKEARTRTQLRKGLAKLCDIK